MKIIFLPKTYYSYLMLNKQTFFINIKQAVDVLIINHFIDENRGKIFPLNCNYCEVNLSAEYSLKQYEIIALMNDLLFKLKKIVARTFINGSDLHELFCLLHAFHNLPRAFFSCST